MPYSRLWALLIAVAAVSCVSCTSSPETSPDSTWSSEQSVVLPPNAEPNSFMRGSVLDPNVSGATTIYYETIDAHGYHSLFKDTTDSTKHFTTAIPMGIKELDVGRKVDSNSKLLHPARCRIGSHLSVPGVRKLENLPAEGAAIVGGVSVIERGKPVVLQTRDLDARVLNAEVDGSAHGVEMLAVSSTSAVLDVYDAAPGTHDLVVVSNGKRSNPMHFTLTVPPTPKQTENPS